MPTNTQRELPSGMTAIAEQVAALRTLTARERSTMPPIPRSAKVELHSNCNLKCSFCAVTRCPRPPAVMDLAAFTRIAHELRDAGVERLGLFYMNEPFPDAALPVAIRIAKEICGIPYVFLTSNGVAATPDQVGPCLEAGLDSLKFAINLSREQLARFTTGGTGASELVIENIRASRRLRDEISIRSGHRCRLSASSLAYDESQRDRMLGLLPEIAHLVDEHYWLPLFGRPELAPRDISHSDVLSMNQSLHKPLPCWTLFTEAHVRCDGMLSACCLSHAPRFEMGSLRQVTFAEAWHSESFKSLRQAHLSGDVRGTSCEGCIGRD